jgi:hypothetical protein
MDYRMNTVLSWTAGSFTQKRDHPPSDPAGKGWESREWPIEYEPIDWSFSETDGSQKPTRNI